MPAPQGKVPIVESVVAALRGWRAMLPRIWPYAFGGALILTLLAFAARQVAGGMASGFLLDLSSFIVMAGVYAAMLHAPLGIEADWRRRGADALRVFASMSVVGFFLFIVLLVAFLPGMMVLSLAFGPAGEAQMAAAQNNPERVLQISAELARAHWPIVTLLAVIYTAIWMALTSRLYLAAPASVADERPRTFETWPWTNGNMWRIVAARLILLGPVLILLNLVQAGFVLAFGLNPLSPESFRTLMETRPGEYFALLIGVQALSLLVANGLEASLSAYLCKGLRPPSPSPAQ